MALAFCTLFYVGVYPIQNSQPPTVDDPPEQGLGETWHAPAQSFLSLLCMTGDLVCVTLS